MTRDTITQTPTAEAKTTTPLRQVTVVTKQGDPHLVFASAQRALEYVTMANDTTPGEPYRLILFAVADAPKP